MRCAFLIFIGLLFFGCQSSTGDKNSGEDKIDNAQSTKARDVRETEKSHEIAIAEEIESLDTDSERIRFQRLIMKSDIDAHEDQSKALQTYGHTSSEYLEATKIMTQNESDNLMKTLGYNEKYGISENQSVGRMQAHAMWLVMSHSTDIEVYREVYPSITKSWEMEYLDATAFASFLQDYHKIIHGSRLELKNPYRTEDEIKALLKAIN